MTKCDFSIKKIDKYYSRVLSIKVRTDRISEVVERLEDLISSGISQTDAEYAIKNELVSEKIWEPDYITRKGIGYYYAKLNRDDYADYF